MTADEYNQLCTTLGVTPTWGVCKLLSVTPPTAWRWSTGRSPVPGPVAVALRTLARLHELEKGTRP